jgi:hypothetical protein
MSTEAGLDSPRGDSQLLPAGIEVFAPELKKRAHLRRTVHPLIQPVEME